MEPCPDEVTSAGEIVFASAIRSQESGKLMRRTIITIATLVSLGGFAEAHPRHHYTHHHRDHGYSHAARHLHFRGHSRHHHHHAHRAERKALAAGAPSAQSWFGTPAPEYPQVRGQA